MRGPSSWLFFDGRSLMKRPRRLRSFSLYQKVVAGILSGLLPLTTLPDLALALPHGGVVAKGQATLGYSTGRLLITQTTSSATFDWGSFTVKSGQSVVYKTPGSSSVSMNYIGGTTPSSIDGRVTSNGILYFMNPNGLIFGSGSVVSAAGVMAFGAGTPWGKPTGAVSNAGVLTATDNGTVALVGSSVTNTGTITAPGGEVLLAAGSTVTPISATEGSSLSVATTGGGLVDDSGILSAETTNGKTGTILLQSGMETGTTTLASTAVLDASAPNGGNGGKVFINGSGVVLNNIEPINVSAFYGAKGTVRIDPNYILSGTTLDICDAAGLEYLDGNQSSYLADTIILESNMNLGGSYGWTPLGTSFSSAFTGTFNGNGYVVSGYTITATGNNGTGFIGDLGSGGVVKNLGVVGTVTGGSYGAVGGVVGANFGTVEISYNSGNVTGSGKDVGGVIGDNGSGGKVTTSYNTGKVSGNAYVGGVVGANFGTVETSSNMGSVTGSGNAVGGVVGDNSSGTVETSYNTRSVSGGSYVGGVVGDNSGMVEISYNTGSVTGSGNEVGGVVGINYETVKTSYNTGKVIGSSSVGGIIGCNDGTTAIVETSYNTGSVSGGSSGGVVGNNCGRVDNTYYNISVSYGSGAIAGGITSGTGILNNNGISPSDFSVTTSATAGVLNLGRFNTWGSGAFNSSATSAPWYEGTVSGFSSTAPMLVSDLPSATVTGNGSSVYSGSMVSPGYTATYTMGGTTLSPNVTVTTAVGPNAGSYANTPSYILSAPPTQTSVDSVSVVSGTWTITPATSTSGSGSSGSSTINGLSGSATIGGLSGSSTSPGVTITQIVPEYQTVLGFDNVVTPSEAPASTSSSGSSPSPVPSGSATTLFSSGGITLMLLQPTEDGMTGEGILSDEPATPSNQP